MQQSVIIIGAGAAGLIAARILSAKNAKVTLIEAGNRPGGRMHTVEEGFSADVEAGAEFIHGNVPETINLLTEAGIRYTRTAGKTYRVRNGKQVNNYEQAEGWDEMMEKMHSLTKDITLFRFLQKYFASDKYAALRAQVRGFAEGYDVADLTMVSVFALRDEWEHEGPQYRVNGGYGRLVNYLIDTCNSNGCSIVTGTRVSQVEWREGVVVADTPNGKYEGDRLIVTVPIVMLQQPYGIGGITFNPALAEYTKAAGNIGYGDVVKVVIEFKTRFWEKYLKKAGFILSDEWMPVWWTQLPGNGCTLTGWLGGPKATMLKTVADEEILQKSLLSLCGIFGVSIEALQQELTTGKVFNWASNPFSGGAYSYATPGTQKALKILMTPVKNTLFFAGEAIYEGKHPGTVEAAFVSGKQAAEKILAL
ncbi:MAG TPA: NAD(P)/FAD-dependent oxidoreductase [Chitinophagaceae bacterium]|nr:NAD(P)/FAD-dependent oxidoreductase [Chitinophagaceae bacterium]